MTQQTTKLDLTLPGGGSTGLNMPPDRVDIDVLNDNFNKIDAFAAGFDQRRVVGLVPAAADAAARDAMFPAPAQGDKVDRLDKGWIERYYDTWNAVTNPGGATPAGWYPVDGALPELLLRDVGATNIPGASIVWTAANVSNGPPAVQVNDGFTLGTTIALPFAGVYDVLASVRWGTSSSGVFRGVRAEAGGVVYGRTSIRTVAAGMPGSGNIDLNLACTVDVAATGFQISGAQDSGGNLSFVVDNLSVKFKRPRRV